VEIHVGKTVGIAYLFFDGNVDYIFEGVVLEKPKIALLWYFFSKRK
jgi:hypothetical protein